MDAVCHATDPPSRIEGFICLAVSGKDVNWRSSGLFQCHIPSWGSQHPMTGPCFLLWNKNNSEKPSRLQCSLWGPLDLDLHNITTLMISFPNPASFLFPSFYKFWSLKHSLINNLHTNFHLRVHFLENQHAISGLPFSLPYTTYYHFLAVIISQWRMC